MCYFAMWLITHLLSLLSVGASCVLDLPYGNFFIGTYAYKKKDIKYSMVKDVYETLKPYKIKGNEA